LSIKGYAISAYSGSRLPQVEKYLLPIECPLRNILHQVNDRFENKRNAEIGYFKKTLIRDALA
jgi:hypothetical protein